MKTVILLGALIASLTSFGFFKKSPKAKNENVKKVVKKADNLNQNKNVTKNININEDKNINSQNLSDRNYQFQKKNLIVWLKKFFKMKLLGKRMTWSFGIAERIFRHLG